MSFNDWFKNIKSPQAMSSVINFLNDKISILNEKSKNGFKKKNAVCEECLSTSLSFAPEKFSDILASSWQSSPDVINYVKTFNSYFSSFRNYDSLRRRSSNNNKDLFSGPYIDGHPVLVLKETLAVFSDFSTKSLVKNPDTLSEELPNLLLFMQHFEILCRFKNNHHIFFHTGLRKILYVVYFIFEHYVLDPNEIYEDIIILFFHLTRHLFDPEDHWDIWLADFQILPEPSFPDPELSSILLSVFVNILDHFKAILPTSKQYDLLESCIYCIAAAGPNEIMQNSSLFGAIACFIRNPVFPQSNSEVFLKEFRIQILAAHVLLLLITPAHETAALSLWSLISWISSSSLPSSVNCDSLSDICNFPIPSFNSKVELYAKESTNMFLDTVFRLLCIYSLHGKEVFCIDCGLKSLDIGNPAVKFYFLEFLLEIINNKDSLVVLEENQFFSILFGKFLMDSNTHFVKRCWDLIQSAVMVESSYQRNLFVNILATFEKHNSDELVMKCLQVLLVALQNNYISYKLLLELQCDSPLSKLLMIAISESSSDISYLNTLLQVLDQLLLQNLKLSLVFSDNHIFVSVVFRLVTSTDSKLFEWSLVHLTNLLKTCDDSINSRVNGTLILKIERSDNLNILKTVSQTLSKFEDSDFFRALKILGCIKTLLVDRNCRKSLTEYVASPVMINTLIKYIEQLSTFDNLNFFIELVGIITIFLADNNQAKEEFSKIDGYKLIATSLLRRKNADLGNNSLLLDTLFNFLIETVEEEFSFDVIRTIRNPQAFQIIARIYPALNGDLKKIGITRFVHLFSSPLNKVVGVELIPFLLEILVEADPESMKCIISELVSFSIKPGTLGSILRHLESQPSVPLISALTEAATRPDNDAKFYFIFPGFQSGISCSSPDNLFGDSGFTFCIWFKIHSYSSDPSRSINGLELISEEKCEEFYLFSFPNMCDGFVKDEKLSVKIQSETFETNYTPTLEIWHFLCINVSKKKFTVFVDQNICCSGKIDSVRSLEKTVSVIGARIEENVLKNSIHGSISFAALFNIAIPETLVQDLFRIGKNPRENKIFPEIRQNITLLLDPRSHTIGDQKICNVFVKSVQWELKNVRICHRFPFKDSINCCGGVHLLLYLLNFGINCVEIIAGLLVDHKENQEDAFKWNVIRTIGWILESSPISIGTDVLDLFRETEEMKPALYRYIAFNFKIWSRKNFEIQKKHFLYIDALLDSERLDFSVLFFLKVLCTYSGKNERLNIEELLNIRQILYTIIKKRLKQKPSEITSVIKCLLTVNESNMFQELFCFLLTALDQDTCSLLFIMCGQNLECLYQFYIEKPEMFLSLLLKIKEIDVNFEQRLESDQNFIFLSNSPFFTESMFIVLKNLLVSNGVMKNTIFLTVIFKLMKESDEFVFPGLMKELYGLFSANCKALKNFEWLVSLLEFVLSIDLENDTIREVALSFLCAVLHQSNNPKILEDCVSIFQRSGPYRWKALFLTKKLFFKFLSFPERNEMTIYAISMVEEILFHYHEFVDNVSNSQIIAPDPWIDGEIIKLCVTAARCFEWKEYDFLRSGGIFRIIIRISLFGLMNGNIMEFCAIELQEILDKYMSEGKNLPAYVDSKKMQTIFFIIGSIFQSLQNSDTDAGPIKELLYKVFMMWKNQLSAFVVDILTINKEGLDDFLASDTWNFAFDSHFLPAIKAFQEEFSDFGISIKTRYLISKRRESLSLKAVEQTFNIEERSSSFLKSCQVMPSQDDTTFEMEIWDNLERDFHSIGGIFGESKKRYKLDFSENNSRMRRKLLINNFFDQHLEASSKRDKYEIQVNVEEKFQAYTKKVFAKKASMMIEAEDKEDDWNIISDLDFSSDKIVYTTNCQMILLTHVLQGRLEITSKNISFVLTKQDLNNLDLELGILKWPLDSLIEIQGRRYMLQRNALEFFFANNTNIFLNFPQKERSKCFQKILQLKPANLKSQSILYGVDIMKKSNITERWKRGEISNFDYLMALNTAAGRTYNDLTQYPVFPWILVDYTSEKIDLRNPDVYRDLSKPVGALNDARLSNFSERYNSFQGDIPKFFYGTHYSSAAGVLFYLIRLEPFTSLHISLQGGKFDHADRQFHSLASTWKSCFENPGDVKELIPEFFYMSEFLENSNEFDLGIKQNGTPLSNVVLPPWANSFKDFIRIHREALESEYVSQNLHSWIDLIFGYKQLGDEAEKAKNVFYYSTYEGLVNIDAITDPLERESLCSQINNFGQTPTQIFDKPHPRRNPTVVVKTIVNSPGEYKPYSIPTKNGLIHKITVYEDKTPLLEKLYSVISFATPNGFYSCRFQSQPSNSDVPFVFEAINGKSTFSNDGVFTFTNNGQYIFSSSYDFSVKLYHLESWKLIDSIGGHSQKITCIEVDSSDKILVTGSEDCTVIVWEFSIRHFSMVKNQKYLLKNNYFPISCVFYDSDHDILAISGRTCLLASKGIVIRDLKVSGCKMVKGTQEGNILVYANNVLSYYSINGSLLGSRYFIHGLSAIISTFNSENCICSDEIGRIYLMDLSRMSFLHQYDLKEKITSMYLSSDDQVLFLSRADQSIIILCSETFLRKDKHQKAFPKRESITQLMK